MLTDNHNNIYDLVKLMERKRISRNSDNYPEDGGFSGAMAGLYSCFDDKSNDYDFDRKYYNYDPSFNFNRSEFRNYHWTGPQEYSQDNYIGLLQGLVAVRKFVNSDVVVNGMRLSAYAAQIIDRIIYSIKDNDSYPENWVIDNRVTDECVKGVFWSQYIDKCYIHDVCFSHFCNAGGAQAGMFSFAFYKIHQLYCSSDCPGCHTSDDIGHQVVTALHQPNRKKPKNKSTQKMRAILGTLTSELTNEKCCELIDSIHEEYQYLDLLYCALHGGTPVRGYSFYNNILDTTRCPVVFSNRSEGNLLSAMIIHNLLKLLRGSKYNYQNYQVNDNNIYPRTRRRIIVEVERDNIVYEIEEYPICNETVVAIHKIESSATISTYAPSPDYGYGGNPCKANVTYKAGKEIHLKPGFKVINGAKFHAYIEPVDYCQVKEGNPDVAVLFYPPSEEHVSSYVMKMNYAKLEEVEGNEPSNQMVNNVVNDNGSLLLPNPATDMLYLQADESGNYRIEIHDIMGRLIEKREVGANENFSVSHLKRGLYIFSIFKDGEMVQKEKIVLQ